MIKNYNTYLKEGKMLSLVDFMAKFENPSIGENELRKKVIGKTVVWYPLGQGGSPTLKRQTVGDINVEGRRIYFNGYPVDQDFDIEIETPMSTKKIPDQQPDSKWVKPDTWEITGFPSGEIIYVKTKDLNNLLTKNLIMYQKWAKYGDKEYHNIYIYRDDKYYKIREFLDPNYKKPGKPLNYKEKDKYHIGEVVLCQGGSPHVQGYVVNLDLRVGKIIDMYKGPKDIEYKYLISFMNKFDPHLVNIGGTTSKYCWWVNKNNIRGLYTGDLEILKNLAAMTNSYDDELQEHELDDTYHIKQVFRSNNGKLTFESNG